MEQIKEQYRQIISNREDIIKQINILEQDEAVKKYLELRRQNNDLAKRQRDLYRQIKEEEYSSCDHIWVNTFGWKIPYNYIGCIKCGLNKRVLYLVGKYGNRDFLTLDEQIMCDILYNQNYKSGIHSELFCDLDLASAVYLKIKEAHPEIDDETTVKYLSAALHNIRDTKVSDDRKENRARRLLLNPKFNMWH